MVFLDALRKELSLIRRGNEKLLSEVYLDRLDVDEEATQTAVICQSFRVIINRRSTVVQTLIDRFDHDPIWLKYMASLVYTALNEWLESITDEEEERFHHHLIELLQSGVS